MNPRPALVVLLLATTALAGCADLFGPSYSVQATPLSTGDEWNTDGRFRVVVAEGATIRIEAESLLTGEAVAEEGEGDVTLSIPDGAWTVTYWINDTKWRTLTPVRIDSTRPEPDGLEFIGSAGEDGTYTIGRAARVEEGAAVRVYDLQTGAQVGDSLPHTVTGLRDGLQVYLVQVEDRAGNIFNRSVQVRVGEAIDLPDGRFTFGVVARYTNEARVWDIEDIDSYMTVAEARQATQGAYLGSGDAIEPDAACVKQVVQAVVTPDMNTAERALALFRWMYDNLEYDDERLETNSLLDPCQTLNDGEDPTDPDADGDGRIRDGDGNGVRGGICRDLAAAYVSLLRAAGVPARIVSGYLAGTVNGFHAWVEFYGGSVFGQDAWIPVDVSPIDGAFEPGRMLQAFGIALPEYLALRTVPPEGEVPGWSTALSMHYTWPQDKAEPQARFSKEVRDVIEPQQGVLCINPATHARRLGEDASDCTPDSFPEGQGAYIDDFTRRTERIIDYGIDVASAPGGARITGEVAYPFPASVRPDDVAFAFYGPLVGQDADNGKAQYEYEP